MKLGGKRVEVIKMGSRARARPRHDRGVVISPMPVGVTHPPLYLHVPPGHEKHWGKHCHKYNACGRPVYFVRNQWYNDVYVPEYQARHGHSDGGHGDDHGGGHNDKGNHGGGHGGGHGKK